MTRLTSRTASRPLTTYLKSGEMSISAAAWRIAWYSCSCRDSYAPTAWYPAQSRTFRLRQSGSVRSCSAVPTGIRHDSRTLKYDAIVIGGGHNGLTAAAYLGKAGRKVLVLERRHVVGGAAVTEEVFPGFKFSVCSYVVSLLRPEIIRELDLPRHGLEILPLDGTFTPMPNGDYLWRVNDHGRTRREIARHSKLDAEAYDEYGKAMIEMAHFVKPILNMTPPDPTSLDPRGLASLLSMAQRFRALPRH